MHLRRFKFLSTIVRMVNSVHTPPLTIVEDTSFTISKLLFGLTRNILLTSSSDIFVGELKLILKILREKVTLFEFHF